MQPQAATGTGSANIEATMARGSPHPNRRAADKGQTVADIARWPVGKFARWLALVLAGALAARGGDVSKYVVSVATGTPAQVSADAEILRAIGARTEANSATLARHAEMLSEMARQIAEYRRDVAGLAELAKEDRVENRARGQKLDQIIGFLEAERRKR